MAITVESPDILDIHTPALSAISDIPVILETKPDSQAAPEKSDKTIAETATAKTKETPAAADEAKTEEESATSEEKPKGGFQKRIDQLSKERAEWERNAKESQSKAEQLIAELAQAKADKEASEQYPEPEKRDYDDPDHYIEAKASWIARQEIAKAQAEDAKRQKEQVSQAQSDKVAAEVKVVQEAYAKRVTEAKTKHEDFEAIAESPDVSITMPMAHAIVTSDIGPEIQYFLGKNPKEAERISLLQPIQQIREIGKLEAQLSVQPKTLTKAPEPIKPVKSSSGSHSKGPEEMTVAEYDAWWKSRADNQRRH